MSPFLSIPALSNPGVSINVLIVDDDEAVAATLARYLDRAGMRCATVASVSAAVAAVEADSPDVVLVDLDLPDANGVSLIGWLAQAGRCGVIVVTGASAEVDRVVGIELGADDYVVKPPSMRELVARIRAVHRRRSPTAAPRPAEPDTLLHLGDSTVCSRTATVRGPGGTPLHLTAAERKVLELLLGAGREPVTRDALCEGALRRPLGFEDRAIDQIVFALRRKLGPHGREAIVSVRGAGYALVLPAGHVTAGYVPSGRLAAGPLTASHPPGSHPRVPSHLA